MEMLELLECRLTQMAFNLATTPWRRLGKSIRHLHIPSQRYRAHRMCPSLINRFGLLMVVKRLASHRAHFPTFIHTNIGVKLRGLFIRYNRTPSKWFRFQIHSPLLHLYYSNLLFSAPIPRPLRWYPIKIHLSVTVEAWQVEAILSMPAVPPNITRERPLYTAPESPPSRVITCPLLQRKRGATAAEKLIL